MFEKDGIVIIEDFLSQETLEKLNDELNVTFPRYSVNGGLYSTQLGTWTENRKLVECTIPGLIYSVNIF